MESTSTRARVGKGAVMRQSAIGATVILIFYVAIAGANPAPGNIMSIDFEPPSEVHSVYPEPYTEVQAHVMFLYPENPTMGITVLSFALDLTPGMWSSAQFTNLLPGDLSIGTWDTGITIASTECMMDYATDVGVLSFIYQGVPRMVGRLLAAQRSDHDILSGAGRRRRPSGSSSEGSLHDRRRGHVVERDQGPLRVVPPAKTTGHAGGERQGRP
jgi:hypothetical protein